MKIIKCKQLSPEWFEARKGKMSSSHSQEIGNNGAGLDTYCKKIVMEMFCNDNEQYTNADLERGIEREPIARMVYEIERSKIEEVGLVEYNDYFVSSPDGLVNSDGLIEIKAMNNFNHFNFILDNKIQSQWLWQMQGQLLATGRDWVDFVAYNPQFDRSLIVVRVEKDLAMQEKLIMGIEKGKQLIENLTKQYEKR